MPRIEAKRFVLALVVLLMPVALLGAAPPKPSSPSDDASLQGQLLVASPEIGDPRFSHTVILMVRHDKKGALGIIINRPVEERTLASLLDAIGEKGGAAQGRVRIFAGGPVEPGVGFIVHSADYHRPETLDIDGHVAMTSSVDVLRDIGQGKGPKESLIAFGYAGWAPGQLEGEIARGDWYTAPEDAQLVFKEDREKVWEDAMSRRTINL